MTGFPTLAVFTTIAIGCIGIRAAGLQRKGRLKDEFRETLRI